jgi:membrane-anchored glycerophosphoryl diester phosphodiesterase (GDPDase)
LAFDELGPDAAKSSMQEYTVGATGLVSRTFGVWSRRLIQYIALVGVLGAATGVVSSLVIFVFFGTIMVVGSDPLSYYSSLVQSNSLSSPDVIALSLPLAVIAFVIYAVVGGAAVKFALDDYSSHTGDIRASYSHSFKRLLNFIGVQLVVSAITAVFYLPGMVLLMNSMSGVDISDPFHPIFPPGSIETMMMGAILILISTPILIYLSSRFAPAVAIVIDTDLSAIGSIKKSWEITGGHVLHVIAGWFLFGISVSVLAVLARLFTSFLEPYALVIQNIVVTLLFGALTYIFPVVLYRDLSSRTKESSLEELLL